MAGGDTRSRLLDVAWDLAREGGVQGLTLGDVAKRAGVSRQAVYLHFDNRATLLHEIARRIDRSSGFIGRLVGTRALDPLDGFRRMIAEWLGYMPLILPLTRALEAAALAGDEGATAYDDRMAEWRGAIKVAVDRLNKDGRLTAEWDVEHAADWVWSRVLPGVYDNLTNVRGWSHDEVVSRTIASLEAELID